MNKVFSVLNRKGNTAITVDPDTTVLEALKIMAEKNIGSVVVMKGDLYQGIITERDYSRKIVLKGRSSNETTVADIMTTSLPTVSPNDSIEQCMQLLTDNNIRYLPVFENNQLAGIISINDVVKEIILSQEETISNLKDYLYANS